MTHSDIAIVGGGIVGLATAYTLVTSRSDLSVTIFEKESDISQHQTGHNSGVLHSGIYYKPGSLKAKNCRDGKRRLEKFCVEERVPFEICGKVIIATNKEELATLKQIYQRGLDNNVTCELINQKKLRDLEPKAAGIAAIHVPETGIVDFNMVAKKMAARVTSVISNHIHLSTKVTQIQNSEDCVVITTPSGEHRTRLVINCAGLHCDRVTSFTEKPKAKIIPFRGEYYELQPEAHHLCRNLIYPVPNPEFPFLGVHFTRMIHGGVECGPNAVLAFAREGYSRFQLNVNDLAETLSYSGFRKMALKYWRTGLSEMWRSFSKRAFVRSLQRLVPEVQARHLKAVPAGVRAQAIAPDGHLLDDFLIQEAPRSIHVMNAPSPAATSCLNIGRLIVNKVNEQFDS